MVYAASERHLHRVYAVPPAEFVADPNASAERGERLVTVRGCNDCHGEHLEGSLLPTFATDRWDRVVAPNIAKIARESSDADLERAIRHGVKADGTSLTSFMASSVFYELDDSDLSDVIAYLRSTQPATTALPPMRIGPRLRWRLAVGDESPLAAPAIDHTAPRIPGHDAEPATQGRYLAHTVCTECHGPDLRGVAYPDEPTPDLAIIRAYSLQDFTKLIRTGIALGERKLELMTHVGQKRFSHFTDSEVSALYAYLSQVESGVPR